ncbi:hypothetical protein DW322_13565 [Rhodococcus rhodnii]|uniref:Uncharacterized protein n=2 Tax=Rhodococcus rhodnii TaxID=38312 RepID=R7WKQ9_9NOCA|nr:hypothetical protein [Rhodococcus rhodnii]EOM75896.1 hypothetical protein Rrhod_2808 [Rhodococcus rhodnii LMG 5362]TXG91061.1 hypothetical protein DW322_13565 [Rhodococcus rhodnii]
MNEPAGGADGPVALDLVPVALVAPRVRAVATGAVVVAVVVGALIALLTTPVAGLVTGLVIAVPVVTVSVLGLRRGITLDRTTLTAVAGLRSRSVDVTHAQSVDLVVRSLRMAEVAVRVTDDRTTVTVPLALYVGSDGGRELEILPLRRLADALARAEDVSAAAVSAVLVDQLRAEARGAGLGERPLYRAVELARSGHPRVAVLSDSEVASLLSDN